MTKEQLQSKLAAFEKEKAELSSKDFSAEIEEKVASYRAQLEEEAEKTKEQGIASYDSYIKLLKMLIEEEGSLTAFKAPIEEVLR